VYGVLSTLKKNLLSNERKGKHKHTLFVFSFIYFFFHPLGKNNNNINHGNNQKLKPCEFATTILGL
jgi:hypothetical protein